MITNTSMIDFPVHTDNYGSLVAVEAFANVPFDIKRVYYIFSVEEDVRRGFHSHKDLEQVLICVHGSVKILVKTPFEEETVLLNNPCKGLYIGPMVWREMFDFSSDAVLLVLASDHYKVSDYIRDYSIYKNEAMIYFNTEKGMN
jgi:dTDP-4-dehydrorhamnose 3,5-epimerase-like enzyme